MSAMAASPSTVVAPAASATLLAHQSINESGDATILFIHGAFGDSDDWDLVVPYLSNYHVLLPDSPGHGRSSHLSFSIESSAEHIARLIAAKAVAGRAHVVGHSLGASIAIRLAMNFPDAVLSTFVSGYSDMPISRTPSLPYLFWISNRIENAVLRPVVRWLMDGTDLRRVPGASLSLCTSIAHTDKVELKPWPSRTLIIVAGKGGLIPSNDNVDAARRLAKVGRQGNARTVATIHPAMRHPWPRQDPKLWAETVISWVEERDMPNGFAPL
jgi:pimeloyl-ACP methyl ester carboxylesterase